MLAPHTPGMKILFLGVALAAGTALTGTAGAVSFQVRADPKLLPAPLEGRAYVIVSRTGDPEPRFQVQDYTDPAPFWGKNATLRRGQALVFNDAAKPDGYPLAALKDLPAGEYKVQAFFNVYTTFRRGDGSVVKLHLPCGDGQNPFASPGNLYSDVQTVRVGAGRTVALVLNHLVRPADPVPPGGTCQQGNPTDSALVKHFKLKSPRLTRFWGRDMSVGADVLLPRDYAANPDARYPVIYVHGHFPAGGNVFGYTEPPAAGQPDKRNAFSKWWQSGSAPRVILVQFRHENPFFDSSYAVNSVNVGPYGDVIARELVPAVDARFRTVAARWARSLTGESTGGWQALAQLVYYPDLYAGANVDSPDPLDFHNFELVDVYKDKNAYLNPSPAGWLQAPRPSTRAKDGEVITVMAQENAWELALGDRARSGLGNWDIWQVTYGPQGKTGYPAPIWDKRGGRIDPKVAEYWKRFDLREYVEKNWPSLAPKLAGRIEISSGDLDNYYLNNGVIGFEAGLAKLSPPAGLKVNHVRGAGHVTGFYKPDALVNALSDLMVKFAPAGADLGWR